MLQYNACVEGASDSRRDQVATVVQGAYYTAYWNNAKHPTSLDKVLHRILSPTTTKSEKPDVDVEAFEEKYRRFEERGGFNQRR